MKQKNTISFQPRSNSLVDLTWPEVALILKKDPIILLPFGNIEQHGEHLPMCVDNLVAEELALRSSRLARQKRVPLILSPSIPVGYSMEHIGFPGTLSLKAETFIDVVLDISRSWVKHGAKKLFFICAHKGHVTHLDVAARILRDETGGRVSVGLVVWWKLVEDLLPSLMERPGGHAGELETSIMLYLKPDLVKDSWKSVKHVSRHDRKASVFVPMKPMNILSRTGTVADSSTASREKGRKIMDLAVARLVEYLELVIKTGEMFGSELT